jgi:DNA-binding transcriptional LysR family regulator
MDTIDHGPAGPGGAPAGVELRHLRYFVAVADAGTFTHAAERMYIAQPTLSQQIRRLEQLVGTELLRRRREGVRLTEAGQVLLEESRAVLSLVDHGVGRTREAAGLGRPRLRFALPGDLPEALAVAAARLTEAAAAADVDLAWIEAPLDPGFGLIGQRRADAGLGWIDPAAAPLPAALEVMTLGQFEPLAWIPSAHPVAGAAIAREEIALEDLARLPVIHGPRRLSPYTYDPWLSALRAVNPRAAFTDPPFRRSLPMTLAFAATASTPTAVLTGPCHPVTTGLAVPPPAPAAGGCPMSPARLRGRPLAATAALVWHADLPRSHQQILVDTAMEALMDEVPSVTASVG